MPLSLTPKGFGDKFDLKLENPRDYFSPKEITFLRKTGTYLWHLMCGTTDGVFPSSPNPDDAHFIEVFRYKTAKPTSKRELLFERFLCAQQEENKLKEAQLEAHQQTPAFKNYLPSRYLGD